MKNVKFTAIANIGKNGPKVEIPFNMKVKDDSNEMGLVWDDVSDAAETAIEKKFALDDFPNRNTEMIMISMDDGEFPVLPISMKDRFRKSKKGKKYSKFLLLPEYEYSLHPLYELYLKLREEGLVDFEYSPEKMKTMSKLMSSALKKTSKRKNTDGNKAAEG